MIDPKASVGENARIIGQQAAILTEDMRESFRPTGPTSDAECHYLIVVAVTAASTATAVSTFNLLNYLAFSDPAAPLDRSAKAKNKAFTMRSVSSRSNS